MTADPDELRLVEAMLFAATEPLEEAVIGSRLPEGADLQAILAALARHYEGRGVVLVRVAGKWAFRTAADLAPRLRVERAVTRRPSRAAVETLAIIAYHQPVTRAEIEEIRGVSLSRGALDTLLEAGWIRPGRRRKTPGRPVTWVTTDAFLEHFGLAGLEDLPGAEELKAAGLLDPRPASSIIRSEEDAAPLPESPDDEAEQAETLGLPLEPDEPDRSGKD